MFCRLNKFKLCDLYRMSNTERIFHMLILHMMIIQLDITECNNDFCADLVPEAVGIRADVLLLNSENVVNMHKSNYTDLVEVTNVALCG